MDHTSFISLFFLAFIASTSMAQSTTIVTGFIEISCSATTFPPVCTSSLLPFATTVLSDASRLANEAISLTESELDNLKKIINGLSLSSEYTNCIQTVQDSFGELANAVSNPSSLVVPSNLVSWTRSALDGVDSCTLGILNVVSPVLVDTIRSGTVSAARMGTIAIDLVNNLIT